MTSPIAPILRAAKTRVASGWCQGHMAVTAAGTPCEPRDPDAARWDAIGAIWAYADAVERDRSRAIYVFMRANGIVPGAHIAWNDRPGMTRRGVLAAFDKAIASVEGKT